MEDTTSCYPVMKKSTTAQAMVDFSSLPARAVEGLGFRIFQALGEHLEDAGANGNQGQ